MNPGDMRIPNEIDIDLVLTKKFGRRCYIGYATSWLREGVPFITLAMGTQIPKKEGEPFPYRAATAELALDMLDDTIRQFIKDKEGALHFRTTPHIADNGIEYVVYCRLVVW